MSPPSMHDRCSNGLTSSAGLYGRRSSEAARTAFGPNRPPTRKVTPVSNGTPTTATSTSSSVSTSGSRANVGTPTKRGDKLESAGW